MQVVWHNEMAGPCFSWEQESINGAAVTDSAKLIEVHEAIIMHRDPVLRTVRGSRFWNNKFTKTFLFLFLKKLQLAAIYLVRKWAFLCSTSTVEHTYEHTNIHTHFPNEKCKAGRLLRTWNNALRFRIIRNWPKTPSQGRVRRPTKPPPLQTRYYSSWPLFFSQTLDFLKTL